LEAILKPKYRKLSDLLIQPPRLIKSVLGDITWKINTNEKVVYLTFDDGPVPYITENILSVLDIFDAKATFFCVGENVKKYPFVYRKILNGGHSVGNHTYSHLNGLKTSTGTYLDNIKRASEYIDSKLFRPPHGRMKSSQQAVLEKEYDIILWDVLSYDFSKKLSKEECFDNVKHFTRAGSIVVFHDNIKALDNMLYALTQTLLLYKKAGYRFEALTEEIVKKQKKPKTAGKSRMFAAFF